MVTTTRVLISPLCHKLPETSPIILMSSLFSCGFQPSDQGFLGLEMWNVGSKHPSFAVLLRPITVA